MQRKHLLIVLFIAMFLWGTSWPSSKILASYTSTEIIAFWRFFFVFLGSFLTLLFLKIPLKIEIQSLKWIVVAGFLNALYTFIFFIAIKYALAGKGGVLVTTMIPIFSYLIFMFSCLISKNKTNKNINKYEIFGVFLGICSGLCLLNLNSLNELKNQFNLLFLCCAFIWALMTIFTHKAKQSNPLVVNFYVNCVSLLLFSWILFDENSFLVFSYDLKFWINLFVVAILSTVIGTSIYYYAIFVLGSIKANSFILITPASALICSYLLLNEIPNFLTLLGCILAILAIYFINVYSKNKS